MGAVRDKFRKHDHFRRFGWGKCAIRLNRIALRLDHTFNDFLIIECLRAARLAALEQTVIPLRVKQPVLIETRLLELMVDIRRQHKVILVFHKLIQPHICPVIAVFVAVDVNISRPVCPVLFQALKRIESAGIHIPETIFVDKIRKIIPESLSCVGESRRCGQSRTRADNNRIRLPQTFSETLYLIQAVFGRYHSLPV